MSESDRNILRQIGAHLWSIFPPDAKAFSVYVQLYEGTSSATCDFVDRTGATRWFDMQNNPQAVLRRIVAEFKRLSNEPAFAKGRFTHAECCMDEDGKLDTKFAYIPEWDSWPGLYMKGVSQIPEDEIGQHNIPHDIWEERVAMAKERPYRT